MTVLAFATYTACCLLVFCAQLAFALREWRSLPRREPLRIDQLYVRVERYFGLAFRAKLAEWLRQAPRETTEKGVRIIDKDKEEIWVHDALRLPNGARFNDIIVADTLVTGYGCRLSREVYTRLHCRVGPDNVLQALAADGDALLGRATRVMRWVDASGEVMLEPGCRVLGRVTSSLRVLLQAGSMVKSVHAPIVRTINGRLAGSTATDEPVPDNGITLDDDDLTWAGIGAGRRKRRMAPDCIAYDGDLTLPTVTVPVSIIVRGNLTVGPRSVLRGDVKATGTIQIGAHSTCDGGLVAGRDIRLGRGVTFHGVVFAEGAVRIGPGVVGSRPDPGVAVYGATTVILAPDVEVHGKVSAGRHVMIAAE